MLFVGGFHMRLSVLSVSERVVEFLGVEKFLIKGCNFLCELLVCLLGRVKS